MPVRPIVRYPAPGLKRPALSVASTQVDLPALGADLVDTMRASPGCVGLAAPQIGVPLRAFCLDVEGHRHATVAHGLVVLFDPEVVGAGGGEIRREGCLSVPHLTADVSRARTVTVRGKDAEGVERTISSEGFEARALLHEIDHLDGLLILDRVASASSLFPRKVYL